MNETQLVPIESKPADNIRLATDVAGLCKQAVVKNSIKISGKNYVKVEGWQTIGAAYGCLAEIESVEEATVEGVNGLKSWSRLKRISDGAILSRASAFLGDDEDQRGIIGKKYARYAKVQTRAISRILSNAFRFVVTMMDAGLETTPAEEIPRDRDESRSEARDYESVFTGVLTEAMDRPAKDKKGNDTGGFVYFGKVGAVSLWTKDPQLGSDFLAAIGCTVEAFYVPSGKSNRLTRFSVKSVPTPVQEEEPDDIP